LAEDNQSKDEALRMTHPFDAIDELFYN